MKPSTLVMASAAFFFASATACKRSATPAPVIAKTEPALPPEALPPSAPAAAGTQLAEGRVGAVSSAEAHATAIGLEVLRAGGNAVDAAVAVGFALSVTHPSAGNVGGGGFMVVRKADGTATSFDFREVAPRAATATMYVNADGSVSDDSRRGPRAAGIPGDVAGFALAHQKFGKTSWQKLVEPAIPLAADGHVLDEFHAAALDRVATSVEEDLAALDATATGLRAAMVESLALWRRADGTHYQAGDTWKQPALAATLRTIADGGADAFYRGPLAKKLADTVTAMGGLWTEQDLADYRAIERVPIEFDHGDYHVITMPPPSAGGITLRQIVAASETLGLGKLAWSSPDRQHLYVEALRRVFADRNLAIADPDFVNVPVATLTDPTYVGNRMKDIDPAKATPSEKVGSGVEVKESTQTTHFSVVDGSGLAVAVTYTLNGNFGAHVVVPGTGITLNNEMDDFTAKVGAANMFGLVQGPQNAIAPGKRMVSSMTPTIVSKGGVLRLVCGSPGGPTIITTVAQILLQVLDHGVRLDAAIASPRVHHQWLPDRITHEATLAPELAADLVSRGHVLRSVERIGAADCIERDETTGVLRAVADVGRAGGAAAAY